MEYEIPDWKTATEGVVCATGHCDGCDDCAYDPVYSVVDGDALDALFEPVADDARQCEHVAIETEQCTLRIDAEKRLTIQPRS